MAEAGSRRLLWLAAQPPGADVADAVALAGWQLLHLNHCGRTAWWVSRLAPNAVVMQMLMQALPWLLDRLLDIRQATAAPIVVLCNAEQEAEQSQLLEGGADALLHSQSSPRLLVARLQALQRLQPRVDQQTVQLGELLVPAPLKGAHWGTQPLELSPAEQALLHELVRRQGRAVTRRALDACLASGPHERRARSVDVMISRLRRRLKSQAVHDLQIRAVHGVGYCLTRLPRLAGAGG